MNTDGTLFSMKKNSREAEAMSMTSFMIPIGLKQKLKDHAAKLGITSTSLIIEGIRLILDRKNEATPQLEEIDTTGADEYVKRKAIKTLLGSPSHHRIARAGMGPRIPRRVERCIGLLHPSRTGSRQEGRQMSEEERIWANALSDAIEPANEYARKIKDRYLVTAKNDMYGIDQTMNIISQAYLAGVEHQAEACMGKA